MIAKNINHPVSIIVLITCIIVWKNNKSNQRISKTKIKHSIDLVRPDGSLITLADSFYIYCSGNKIVYQLSYTHTVENDTAILLKESKYNYLVYKKEETYGRYFDTRDERNNRLVRIDSFLSDKTFSTLKFYDKATDSLIETISINNGKIILERYLSKVKNDQSYPDTAFFYYSDKFKDVNYSFSPILDQRMKKKVYKLRMVYISQFYEGVSFKMPHREFLFEMEDCTFNKSDTGLAYLREK